MTARLVILTGSLAGTAYDLGTEDVTFGRQAGRTITFGSEDVLVSARHATLYYRNGRFVIRDDGSRNGTYVNGESIRERELADKDLIQFGAGGPGARFLVEVGGATPTLDPQEMADAIELLKRTRRRDSDTAPAIFEPNPLTTTRELVVMAVRRAKRTRRLLGAVAAVTLIGLSTVIVLQQLSKANLQRTLTALSASLATERESRSALEETLAQVQSQAASLNAALAQEQTNPRLGPTVIRDFSQGVALIVFTYGFAEERGTRFLRYEVDDAGDVVMATHPDGGLTPSITFGGSGPPLRRQGTATGFLVDTAGFLISNRHIAVPWEEDEQLDFIRSRGLNVTGRFIDLRAYFPPGDESRPLVVSQISDDADVALLRVLGDGPKRPALPLAPPNSEPVPGDELLLIGYPTGVHNLLFRVNRQDRADILRTAGDDASKLAEELATRRLIQPLITSGSISDTTGTEVIHTAATTVGGSGGPLIDGHQQVVAIHYASVRSPAPGDPFQTQRGVPIRFAWSILPPTVRRRLVAEER